MFDPVAAHRETDMFIQNSRALLHQGPLRIYAHSCIGNVCVDSLSKMVPCKVSSDSEVFTASGTFALTASAKWFPKNVSEITVGADKQNGFRVTCPVILERLR